MLAFQAMEYYTKTEKLLQELNGTFDFFEKCIPYDEKKNILVKILNSTKQSNSIEYIYKIQIGDCNNGEPVKNYNTCFSDFNMDFEFHEFYKLVSGIEMKFSQLCDEYNFIDESIKSFIEKLNNLSKLHEILVRNSYKNIDKINFFEEVEKVAREYNLILKMVSSFISSITNNSQKITKQDTNLNIQLLDVGYSVKEFYEILYNIDSTYNTLQTLTKEQTTTLEIRKIESGSLLADLAGNEIVVGTTIYLLTKIIDIVYKKYSDNGKLDLSGKEIKTIAESAETMQKLKDLGIKVNKNTEKQIGECLASAINSLHKVIVKAPKIKINGKAYSVADAQKYLENSRKLLDVETKVDDDIKEK